MEEGKNPYTGFIEVIKSNAREEDEKMSSFFMQAKVSLLITCSILQASLEAVSSSTPIETRNS